MIGGAIRGAWGALALASILLQARSATAESAACASAHGPWLRVAFDGDGFGAALRARVLQQMTADLGERGIVTCEAPAEGTPLGDVRITLARPALLSIDLRDDVTDKRVSRSLSLKGIPADARGLSIALATEELLHASWIEAALEPPPAPAPPAVPTPVPPAVLATNDAVVTRLRRSPTAYASLVATTDHAAGGVTGIGGDVRLQWGGAGTSPGARAGLGVRVGARGSPDASSAHGTIREQELLVGIAGLYALVARDEPLGAEVVARVDAIDVQLTGVAAAGAQASSGAALGFIASGGLSAWLRLGELFRLVAEGLAGAPLHGVTASDTGRTTTGLTGPTIEAALGAAVAF